MSRDERVQMWKKRIDTYRFSDAPSVKAWCTQNQVSVQSMYNRMKRTEREATRPNTQCVVSEFLKDGRLELDNSRAERSIKLFGMGRKAWMFAQSMKGATASAIIYSIVETAKENQWNPLNHLTSLFEQFQLIDLENVEQSTNSYHGQRQSQKRAAFQIRLTKAYTKCPQKNMWVLFGVYLSTSPRRNDEKGKYSKRENWKETSI